jgi:hypothetical protein
MGKSYRRHHKRPKRKNTRRRRRRGGADGDAPKISDSMSDMSKHLNKAYESGEKAAQPHVDRMNKMAGDLHNQAKDTGKKAYSGFKYSSPSNFAIAKTGETAYTTTSKAVQPHIARYSSLFTKNPNVDELKHAQDQAEIGTPMQNDPIYQRQGPSP